jgi:hypothetical protein
MIRKKKYLIGFKKGDFRTQSIIEFSYSTENKKPEIILIKGYGREADGMRLFPEKAFDYIPMSGNETPVDEIDQTFTQKEAAELSWFEKKCVEANCTWFVDYVKRMATGEDIPLEEIQTAYRTHHNGLEMKSTSWQNFDLSDLP